MTSIKVFLKSDGEWTDCTHLFCKKDDSLLTDCKRLTYDKPAISSLSATAYGTAAEMQNLKSMKYARLEKDGLIAFEGVVVGDSQIVFLSTAADRAELSMQFDDYSSLLPDVEFPEDVEYWQDDSIKVCDPSDASHSLLHILYSYLFAANPYGFTISCEYSDTSPVGRFSASAGKPVMKKLSEFLEQNGLAYYMEGKSIRIVDIVGITDESSTATGTTVLSAHTNVKLKGRFQPEIEIAPVSYPEYHQANNGNPVVIAEAYGTGEWLGGGTKVCFDSELKYDYKLDKEDLIDKEFKGPFSFENNYSDCITVDSFQPGAESAKLRLSKHNYFKSLFDWGTVLKFHSDAVLGQIKGRCQFAVYSTVVSSDLTSGEAKRCDCIWDEAHARRYIRAQKISSDMKSATYEFKADSFLQIGSFAEIPGIEAGVLLIVGRTDFLNGTYLYEAVRYYGAVSVSFEKEALDFDITPASREKGEIHIAASQQSIARDQEGSIRVWVRKSGLADMNTPYVWVNGQPYLTSMFDLSVQADSEEAADAAIESAIEANGRDASHQGEFYADIPCSAFSSLPSPATIKATCSGLAASMQLGIVENGNNGYSSAQIALYKRSSYAPPAYDGGVLAFVFSTHTLTGDFGTWSRTIPSGNDPLYVIYASAFANAETDTIAVNEWTTPEILSENGTAGEKGLTVATVPLYQRSATAPSKPSAAITYYFEAGTISGLTQGWSKSIPSGTLPIWIITATAVSRIDNDSIEPSEWSEPAVLAKDGINGLPADWLELDVSNTALKNGQESVINASGSGTVTTTITANGSTVPYAKISRITPFHLGRQPIVLKNSVVTNTQNWASSSPGAAKVFAVSTDRDWIVGHKYYMRCKYKYTTTNQNPEWVRFWMDNGSEGSRGITNLSSDTEYVVSGVDIKDNQSTASQRAISLWNGQYDAIDGVIASYKEVMLIDLTAHPDLLEALAIAGVTEDAQIKAWLDENVPWFPDEFTIGGSITNLMSPFSGMSNGGCTVSSIPNGVRVTPTSGRLWRRRNQTVPASPKSRFFHKMHSRYLSGTHTSIVNIADGSNYYWSRNRRGLPIAVNLADYPGEQVTSGYGQIVPGVSTVVLYDFWSPDDFSSSGLIFDIWDSVAVDTYLSGLRAFMSLLGIPIADDGSHESEWLHEYLSYFESEGNLSSILPSSLLVTSTSTNGLSKHATISYVQDGKTPLVDYAISDSNVNHPADGYLAFDSDTYLAFNSASLVYEIWCSHVLQQSGTYVWMRTLNPDGTYTYSCMSGQDARAFSISCDRTQAERNLRLPGALTYAFKMRIQGYNGASPVLTVNGTPKAISWNARHDEGTFSMSIAYRNATAITAVFSDSANNLSQTLYLPILDTTGDALNLGVVEQLPANGVDPATGNHLVTGDWAVLASTNVLYVWNGSGWETKAVSSTTDFGYLEKVSKSLASMLQLGTTNKTTATLLGVFQMLCADEGFIKALKTWSLLVGQGNETSGFYVKIADEAVGSTHTYTFVVKFNGQDVFKIEPATGKVYIGSAFWYDPADGCIKSTGGEVVINENGTLLVQNGSIQNSFFNGSIDSASFSSLPGEIGTTYSITPPNNSQEGYNAIKSWVCYTTYMQPNVLYRCTIANHSEVKYVKSTTSSSLLLSYYSLDGTFLGDVGKSINSWNIVTYRCAFSGNEVSIKIGGGDSFKFKNLPVGVSGLEDGQVYEDNGMLKIYHV